MRRLIASIVALLMLAGVFVPAAMASLQPVRPSRACCVRAHHKHECHEAAGDSDQATEAEQPQDADHLHADRSCCPQCGSPALISQPATNARQVVVVVVPTPQHPFAHEFYPFEAAQQPLQAQPQRAPPAKKPGHFSAINSLIAFVRHHI